GCHIQRLAPIRRAYPTLEHAGRCLDHDRGEALHALRVEERLKQLALALPARAITGQQTLPADQPDKTDAAGILVVVRGPLLQDVLHAIRMVHEMDDEGPQAESDDVSVTAG